MHWEVEIRPRQRDPERDRIGEEYDLLTHTQHGAGLITCSARGYLVGGNLGPEAIDQLIVELLVDSLAETGCATRLSETARTEHNGATEDGALDAVTVLLKPGVMDPAALSVKEAAADLGLDVRAVQTFRRYYLRRDVASDKVQWPALQKVLVNEAIEQMICGPLQHGHLVTGTPYQFRLKTFRLNDLNDDALEKLSRNGQLSLNRAEMLAIQAYFGVLGRDPTDVELETIAQTWSEHCSHKTLKGRIDFNGQRIENLLKETIFGATQAIRNRLGADDWCVSVFEDNAGIVRFDDRYNVCFKVETHNHPSAIEPYGGANTGLGGVIRDPLGTGLGARPVCNTDVFCFAPPDTAPETLPPGTLHPKKVMRGVVAGVRDYGNRMGIPTVNGAVCFDSRYLANPLVYCGTVGLIPIDCCRKEAIAGDLVVVVGGRTGRDGIHGATFSSVELTAESDRVSGGAVQIGNAITEKKLQDVILQARDRGLYHAITDCGAGGFSSAVGEMAEHLGALVHLDQVPLKYEGLSYTEIWISESQERMVLAVPPERWPALEKLCRGEDVEATVIGNFEPTGRLRLHYREHRVAELEMKFLHQGRPAEVRQATWPPSEDSSDGPARTTAAQHQPPDNFTDVLLKILGSYNVCSKEWIIRQYDHEVQGTSVLKPLVGASNDGPGDASVIAPVLGSWTGLAVGCGINPRYGDLDPYAMAAAVIDEAVRNVVAVGADPAHCALLDNFCWGNADRPEVLGSLVRAAQACHDVALAYSMPFISGKDSLNNEYQSGERHIAIPPTLLISALARVPDVRRCVTMDFKGTGHHLYLLGQTRNEMAGSHYHLVHQLHGGTVPQTELELAPRIFRKLHEAIQRGLIRACHDLSEGGLAVAVAEMALAGNIGADLTSLSAGSAPMTAEVLLFAESSTRFIVEVSEDNEHSFQELLGDDVPWSRLGQTCKEPRLRIAGPAGQWIVWAELAQLKEAWQKPLRW